MEIWLQVSHSKALTPSNYIYQASCFEPIVHCNSGVGIGIAIGATSSFAVTTLLVLLCFIVAKLRSKTPPPPPAGEQVFEGLL